MRTKLLLSLATLSALSVSATGPLAFERVNPAQAKEAKGAKLETPACLKSSVVTSKAVSKHVIQQNVDINGMKMKRMVATGIQPLQAKAAQHAASENASLYESFEGWDGNDETWLPDGWSAISKDSTNPNPWGVGAATSWFAGCDGDNAAFVNFSESHCDEYLISTAVTVKENEQLSFMGMLSPAYFYSMDNVDWDTYEYEGDKVVVQTFKVLVSEDNGETWTTIADFSDVYKDYSLLDMLMMDTWDTYTFPLTDYVGKTIRIAFEYEGTDGNTNGVDAVSVDVPALDVSYAYPAHTQYFGISADLSALPYTIALEPVFSPITWTNTTASESATYSWYYMTADNTMETVESTDLTASYNTDFTSAFTTRNNLYYPPQLTGTAAGAAPGTFSRCDYFQVGGKSQFEYTDMETDSAYVVQHGFCAFDPNLEEITIATADDNSTPLFGYSPTSDEYWTNYSFPDADDRVEGNYAYVDGIMNIYQPAQAPMVIEGGWVSVYGKGIEAEHEFKLEIIPLTEEGALGTPLASSVIKGSDASLAYEGTSMNYYTLNFVFAEPVIMSRSVCDQYVVRLTGIHGSAEYLAPIQSQEDNPDGLYIGAVQKVVSWMNNPQESLTMTYRVTGRRNAFAIMLDATYPWLQGNDEVQLTNNVGSLALNSYYDGEKFTVTAPDWLQVTVAGVNDQCVASFAVVGEPDATDVDVTLSVPGFSKVVRVKGAAAGIASTLVDANAAAQEYVTLAGVRLGATAPKTAGVYLARYSDGSVRKVVVK